MDNVKKKRLNIAATKYHLFCRDVIYITLFLIYPCKKVDVYHLMIMIYVYLLLLLYRNNFSIKFKYLIA